MGPDVPADAEDAAAGAVKLSRSECNTDGRNRV
jgi:hypothetical protein